MVSPDGDMVDPALFINDFSPPGVHHNHKYWEMEMVLDTDYLPSAAANTVYWAYGQQVQSAVLTSRAINCDEENDWIEWLKVYIRESDGTQTCLTYAAAEEGVVWCIGETANFNNEIGARHQTKTFKFICFRERGKDSTTTEVWSPGVNEEAIKTMRVDNFTIGNACVNVLRFEDEFIMNMTPQFLPNYFQGVDLKQDQQWRVLTIVVDSETDIFDTYIDITTANSLLPANFYVTFTLATYSGGAGIVERWTYSGGLPRTCYILNRLPGRIDDDVDRDTLEYQILTTCNRAVTHP